ncbi:hypothetical protein TB1_026957 [Malus domestica]
MSGRRRPPRNAHGDDTMLTYTKTRKSIEILEREKEEERRILERRNECLERNFALIRLSHYNDVATAYIACTVYINVCELATYSNVLVVRCTLTAKTHHMINKKVSLALGRDGVTVNVRCGAIIDEEEMVQCLVQREIKGAGLDVFENESEVLKVLFGLDNVVLSPHQADTTEDYFKDLSDLAVANLEAFFSNKPLLSEGVND